MRIPEYDDGYGSAESFERAGCDTEETLREPEPHTDRIAAVMASPSTSFWLKASLDSAINRDPLDALRDAELLMVLLSDRLRNIQGSQP